MEINEQEIDPRPGRGISESAESEIHVTGCQWQNNDQ